MDRTFTFEGQTTTLPGRGLCCQLRSRKHPQANDHTSQLIPCRREIRCEASATLDRLPLSSYDFPELPSGAVESSALEVAVKEAVKHIGQAPFLQLQKGQLSSRHDASDRVLEDPQVWEDITQHLAQRDAEIVLLVHRLDKLEPERVSRKVQGSFNVMTGITSASEHEGLASIAELLTTGTAKADFSGRVGDCCDEDVVSQVVPFTWPSQSSSHHQQHHHHHHHHHHRHATLERSQRWQAEKANHWGVVLQSKSNERESGCYILKTVHSGVGDCTCVHWTLTRVRQGASIFEQMNSAWLL